LSEFEGTLAGNALTISHDLFPGPLERSTDHMDIHPSQAPMESYDAWREWADHVIDDFEDREGSNQHDRAACDAGDGLACTGLGNGLKQRKPAEAQRLWIRGCDLGDWIGCRFAGNQSRYESILKQLCSQEEPASFKRNFACNELGKTAETDGRIADALTWYQLGCNEKEVKSSGSNCDRLEALRR
jgi:hypothetical protein